MTRAVVLQRGQTLRTIVLAAVRPTGPTILSVSPAVGLDAGGTTLTITGTGFRGGVLAMRLGASPGITDVDSVAVVSDTTITCATRAYASGPRTVNAYVRTADGGAKLASAFRYVGVPAPVSATPSTGYAAGGYPIVIAGASFTGASVVMLDGVSVAFTVDSDSQITITAAPEHDPGAVDIAITTPGGTGTLAAGFTFVPTVPLAVVACGPIHALYSDTTTLTLTGTGFRGVVSVEIEPYLATPAFAIVDDETITLSFDGVGLGASPGDMVSFKATRSFVDHATGSDLFTCDYPVPAFMSVDVATGTTAGGDARTITGSGFTGATGVTFGGSAATSVVVVDDSTITCDTPAHAAGAVDIVIANPQSDSGASGAGAFTYSTPAPVVVGISPNTGTTAGGTHVIIEVDDSTGATGAAIDGVGLTGFAIDDGTHVSGDTVADSAGAKDVTVTNGGGTSSPLVGGFTYVDPFDPTTPGTPTTWQGRSYALDGVTGIGSWAQIAGSAVFVPTAPDAARSPIVSANDTPDFFSGGPHTTDFLAAPGNISDLWGGGLSTDPGTMLIDLTVTSIQSGGGAVYQGDGCFYDTANRFGVVLDGTGGTGGSACVRAFWFSGGFSSVQVDCPSSGRIVVLVRRQASVIGISIDGGATWVTSAIADITGASNTQFGKNPNDGAGKFKGTQGALITYALALSDPQCLQLYNWAVAND